MVKTKSSVFGHLNIVSAVAADDDDGETRAEGEAACATDSCWRFIYTSLTSKFNSSSNGTDVFLFSRLSLSLSPLCFN